MPALLDDSLVIVLAGGAGERLYPLTKERAKPAVLLRRAVPHHRLRAEQLHQLGAAAHLHRHAVQVALAQPAHPHGLEHRLGGARRVRRDPAAAEARRRALVSGHGRRGLPEPVLDRAREPAPPDRAVGRPRLQDGLRADAAASTRSAAPPSRSPTIEVPIADAQPLRHHRGRRGRARHRLPGEAARSRRRFPARPTSRSRRWASTSSTPTCWSARSRRTRRSRPTHDFGKDIIPALIHEAPVYRLPLLRREQEGVEVLARHRHARRVLRGEHGSLPGEPGVQPVRSGVAAAHVPAAGAAGEVRVRRRRAAAAARRSTRSSRPAASSRAARIYGSVLCPNVRVHSFCHIEQCILMPGVRVGRHARIRRAIIDRDVLIPRGALIGYNAEEDRRRHTVTDARRRRRHDRRRAVHRTARARRRCGSRRTPTGGGRRIGRSRSGALP